METQVYTEQDERLARALAARLDSGNFSPVSEDSPDMKALLQTYAQLYAVMEEPEPAFYKQLKRSLLHNIRTTHRSLASRWLSWLSWPRRNWQSSLLVTTTLLLVVALVAQSLFSPPQYMSESNNTSGGVTSFGYDGAYNRGKVVDSQLDDSAHIVSQLPGNSKPVKIIDSKGNVTYLEYDSVGNLTKVVDPLGRVTQYEYDSLGLSSGTEIRNGPPFWDTSRKGATYTYDANGYLTAVTSPSGSTDDRMVVQRASLVLVVKDASTSLTRLQEIVTAQQGMLTNTEIKRTANGSLNIVVSLRVPTEALEDALAQIKSLGTSVIAEHSTSEDVTASYVDLDARLKNLELTETELRELLKASQERGDKAQDILSVYNALRDTRGQIEQLKAQKDLLEKSVAMAQIDVSLIPEEIAPGFRPLQVLNSAWARFLQVLGGIVTGLIWILVFLPIPLVLVGAVIVIIRRVKSKILPYNDSDEDLEEAE